MPTAFQDKAGETRRLYSGPQGPAEAGAPLHPSVPSAGLPGQRPRGPGISISVKARKQCLLCGEMKVGRRVAGVRLKSAKGGGAGIRGGRWRR